MCLISLSGIAVGDTGVVACVTTPEPMRRRLMDMGLSLIHIFVPIYLLINIWRGTGYNSIVYIAALTSIPEEQYEAAQADGAGRWKQFWNITLPGLLPCLLYTSIPAGAMQTFDSLLVLLG